MHTIHNVWGFTSPGEAASWGLSPTTGPWLAQHLWEHYAFGGDVRYLRERAYPVMKAACEFYLDVLAPNAKGQLVTLPSASRATTTGVGPT